ncbi:MAG: erythromycin esterase family protein [Betaproteobacteria bacterium]|nr:erythromycin esterase family protein [Betaproteobacteria bacterium]
MPIGSWAGDAAALSAARADRQLVSAIRQQAQALAGTPADYKALLESLRGKRFVLLGEDTHGSEEIYRERARITRRLIEDLGFDGLVIESDFTAVERTNRYVRGGQEDASALAALSDHRRFPVWMWVNEPFAELISDLRAHNLRMGRSVQVFGMDLHGMDAAAAAVLRIARAHRAPRSSAIVAGVECLAVHGYSTERYRAAISANGSAASCAAALAQSADGITEWLAQAGAELDAELRFSIQRNLAQLRASEAYSRIQVDASENAWNHRDRFLAETVTAIARKIESEQGRPARLVLWAHNTHLADARATDRGKRSAYLSLGQEMRQRFPEEAYIIGFTTRLGTVRAAPNWGEDDRVCTLRRPAWESVSALFGRVRIPAFWLTMNSKDPSLEALDRNLPMRAIGVVYWPHAERREHYFRGDLRGMFDAIIHLDQTQALRRLP